MKHNLRDEKGRFKKAEVQVPIPDELKTIIDKIDSSLQHEYGAHSKAEAIEKVCCSYFSLQAEREKIALKRERDAELTLITKRSLDLVKEFSGNRNRRSIEAVESIVTAFNAALKA